MAISLISVSHVLPFVTWCPRQSTLNCPKICSLAENTSSKAVFNEVLAAAGRDIVTKDISRLRGGWPMQDAFYVSYNFFVIRIITLSILNASFMVFFQYDSHCVVGCWGQNLF